MNIREPTKSAHLNVMTSIAYLACLLCLVGVRLPWANMTTPILTRRAVEVSVLGTRTPDGKLVAVLTLAAGAILVALRFAHKRWLAVAALLVGLAIAATGIANSVNLAVSENEIRFFPVGPTFVSVGSGLYVVTLGGLMLAAAAAYLAVTARRRRRDDVIIGGPGADSLDGGNTFDGGAGGDPLDGGSGGDYAGGGSGADTCASSESSAQCEN